MTDYEDARTIVPRALLPITPSAEHSMAMPSIRRRWSPAEVRALMDESRAWPRYELIGGELVVTPAPGSRHQIAIFELMRRLDDYLQRDPAGVVFASPADLVLQPDTITQPDAFVVPRQTSIAGDALAWSDVSSLLLAVEVLSPSSVRTDRVDKRDLYMDGGVAEYWIIDLDGRVIERWTPGQETPVVLRETLTWAPSNAQPLVIDLPTYFQQVSRKSRLVDA